jgi:hypothetical protein
MRKTVFTLLAVLATTLLIAQESMLNKNDKVINLSIGFGNFYYIGNMYSTQIPPVAASLELGFIENLLDVENLNLGIGGYLGFSSNKETYLKGTQFEYGYRYTNILLGGRAALHYPVIEKFDTYMGLVLGARVVANEKFGTATNWSNARGSGPLYFWFVGGRYYFTDNLALLGELGYGISYLNVGIAVKF